jgi:hypothetical protein
MGTADGRFFPIKGSRLHGSRTKAIAEFPMCPNPCQGHLLWEEQNWCCTNCNETFNLFAEPTG